MSRRPFRRTPGGSVITASPSRRRLPALIAGLLTGLIGAGSLAPFVAPVRAATTVTPATGGGAISADTAANAPSPAWTSLTGPSIAVTQAGDIATGSITLTAPSGFSFNPLATPTINAGTSGLAGTCAPPTSTTVTCTVTTQATAAGTVAFSGIAVQPDARTTLASGTMTFGGTAGLTGAAASLAEVAGTAAKLAFSAPPGGGTAWAAWATQPVVTVQDAAGNQVTGSGASITLAIGTNPPGTGTLSCDVNPLAAAAGTAAFSGCQIDKVGTGYTLVASSAGLTSATSPPFTIAAGQNLLVFTTQPGGGPAGTAFATQPVVTVKDPGGTTDTTSTASITLQIGTNPAGGTLTCATGLTKAAVAGVATFSGCKIDKPGTGYTITAIATGLTGVTSAPFNIIPGAPAAIVFSTQPGGGSAGIALSPQPVVTIQDIAGNTVTTSSASITLGIATGTGTSGATLACTGGTSLAAASGVATFSGCAISKAGTGYKLTATTSGLASVTSNGLTVSAAPATQLAVTTQPSSSAGAATAFATQPVIAIRDAGGNIVTSSTLAVTLAITGGTGTPGAILACSGGLTKTPVSGVATFSGCNIDLLGSGYTLTATASGLTSSTTTAIAIVPGAATKVAFTTQPVGAAYGLPFTTQPVVTIQDSMGNTVTSSSASVTLTITTGTGASGAVLSCAGGSSKAASSGVVTFSGCSISKAGTGYRLTATATGMTTATSVTFDMSVGAPAKLTFITQPGGTSVGTPLNPQPAVAIQDAAGNLVASSTLAVTLSITTGTGASGAALTCTGGNAMTATGGIASFSGCAIDKVGSGYTLTASAAGLTNGVSAALTISAGAASKLAFSTQPIGGTVGSLLSQQPVVVIQDAGGNTVTSSTASVTLSIGTNPGGGTLTCSSGLSKAASSGVATFSGCKIDRVGSGYTITAVASGLMGTTSSPLDITPGVPSKLAYTVQPSNGAYATAFPTQPSIAVQDSLGNTVTSYSGTVILSITPGTGAAGATLSCTGGLAKATTSGVAAFAGCAIDRPGSGYTLTATMTGVTNAVSMAFAISPGAATHLAFTTQPAGATAGTAFTTQPVVTVLDAGGNVVTGSSAGITLSITPATGTAGATLACTGSTSMYAVSGVARFSGCKIDLVGSGYTLTASSTSLTDGVSAPLAVSAGPPVKLGFSVQPAGAAAGVAFTTQPAVTIQDAGGNVVTTSSASVTLAITTGTGTSGATISCSGGTSKTAVSGVATFSGCQIPKVGTNYTLKATSGTLTVATSAAFSVTPGSPAKLVVTTQPVGAAYGLPLATQPVITIQDAYGNTATQSSLAVTLAISPGTGAAGASLTCTGGTTSTAVAGIAAFSGCAIDKASSSYTLSATATGVTGATTATFTISPGTPAKLAFTTQPAGATANTAFSTQPVVTIQDAAGNTVTTATLSVTLAVTSGTGASGAILSCGTSPSKTAVAGVAAFSSCKIDRPGTAYTLTATSGSLTPAISTTFDIASGPAAKLIFSTQPVGAAISTAFTTQPSVTIQDAAGNTVISSSAVVTLSITSATGGTGAILSCGGGLSVAAVNGVATFAGCQIDKAGTNYTLKATSGTLTAATSAVLTISPGPASKLAVTTQPAGAAAGAAFTTQPTVTVQDASSGTASASAASITLALGNNPIGATITCAGGLTQAAAAGVASFSGCAIDKVGTGYTLVATSAGLTSATSIAFNVTAGAAAKLILTTQPSASAAFATAFAQQPVVAIQDAAGNTATTSTQSVTIAITPGTGVFGAKLTCTGGLSKAAAAGVATFSGCAIDKAGTGYTLTVTAGSLIAAVSSAITITAGTATRTAFTTNPPATAAAGTAFTTQPVVTIQDAAGNTVTSAALTITLSIVAPASTTAVLTCTGGLSMAAVAGVASFSGCAIDKTGTGYAIGATVSGLTSAKSAAITIGAGAAAKVSFKTDPVGAAGGVAFSKQPIVAVQDTYGNTATTSTGTVTLVLSAGTGTAGAILTCSGGLSKAAAAGVATFTGCTIDKAGTGYKLTATVTGLTAATSTALDISQGPAKQLGFETQPVGGPGGLDFPSQPVVAVQDAGGATVATGTAAAVTLAITTGTGTAGAVLSCTGGLVQTAVSGLATFSGCTIDRAGTGYTLSATSGGLTLDVSDPLDVSAPVAVMTVTPATAAIRYGGATTLGVAFSFAGANATVDLEESIDGKTWALVSPVTTDADGSATFTYLVATTRWFRVTYGGDRELLPGTSKPVKVAVQYSTILRPTNKGATKTIRHGKTITFTAYVRPTVASTPRTSVTFEIYKSVGGKWAFVTRRVVATNALGTASLKWTFARTGTWSIRARAAGTTQNSTSPWTARETYRVT